MRISDWSLDVCSSDLVGIGLADLHGESLIKSSRPGTEIAAYFVRRTGPAGRAQRRAPCPAACRRVASPPCLRRGTDRKSGVSGRSGAVRGDPGGRRSLEKKLNRETSGHEQHNE